MKIPKLRFKEFSDSWEEKSLGEISSNIMYGLNSSATDFDGKNKYIRITDIDENTGSFKPNPLTSPSGELDDNFLVNKNDILFARTGASVGKTYHYNELDGKLYFAGFLIRFNINKADSKFVYYNTLRNRYSNWIKLTSMRTGQPGVNAEEYKSYKFNLPSFEEQEKIGNFLSSVDKKISITEEKLNLFKEYKKGMMQKIFKQEIRFKDENGNDYPDWVEKRLGDISLISAGGDIKKENFSEKRTDKFKFPIYANSLDKKGLYGYSDIFKIENESITVTARGNIGVATYRNENYFPIVRLLVIKMDSEKYSHKYFSYFINTIKIIQEVTGVPQLTAPQLREYKVLYPLSFEEQEKIAEFLSSIDNKIENLSNKLENLKLFKKGLLQKMFV